MLTEIATGVQSLNAAMTLLKTLNAASNQAAINEVKLELQGRIFEARDALSAAQDAQTAVLERVRDLEQEIVRLKDWEGEKQNYELQAVDHGAFAYMEKEGVDSGKPPHWLCTNCFEQGHPSILQFQTHEHPKGGSSTVDKWACNRCNKGFGVDFRISPARMRPSRRPE